MATTADLAAQARKDALYNEYINQQGNTLSDAYNQQVNAAQVSAQNNLAQLAQAAQKYQDTFNTDARSAYITKMQNDQLVDNELTRMGLTNSGYGVTQKLMSAANYGENVAGLQKNLANNLAGIDAKKADVNVGLQQTLADLASDYANKRTNENQWLANYLQNAYNTEYNRVYQQEQDKLANQLAMARAYSSGGSSSKPIFEWTPGTTFKNASNGNITYTNPNGASITVKAGVNPYTNTKNADVKNGTFSNGYQPNNVNNKKLTAVKGETVTIAGNNQSVWTTGSKNYVWDGMSNTYREVKKNSNGEWVVK